MDIGESLHRILQHKGNLTDRFYERFLQASPEIRRHFDGVNMRLQGMNLMMALMAIERHAIRQYPATHGYLQHLGTKHQARGISPELYPKFREDLLAALADFHGPDWDDRLEAQWSDAIDQAIRAMLEGYWERFNV